MIRRRVEVISESIGSEPSGAGWYPAADWQSALGVFASSQEGRLTITAVQVSSGSIAGLLERLDIIHRTAQWESRLEVRF
jgi:hypothetical protein